jgi:WD40 repeat protein
MSGGSDSLSSFGFIRDEDAIIFPDDKSGSDHIWSVTTDAEIRNFPVTGASYTFAASEDCLTVASSADYVTYSCYDTKTGLKTGDVKIGGVNGTRNGNTVLTKNSAYVADQVSGANVIRIFKISDGTSTIKLLSGTNYVASVAASRNEQYLAAVTSGKIRIWKLQ